MVSIHTITLVGAEIVVVVVVIVLVVVVANTNNTIIITSTSTNAAAAAGRVSGSQTAAEVAWPTYCATVATNLATSLGDSRVPRRGSHRYLVRAGDVDT